MYPPLHAVCAADSSVQALLNSGDGLRLYPFGQSRDGPVVYPYAVWQIVGGTPENYLGDLPNADRFTTQVDVYASGSIGSGWRVAREVADAIQAAIEPVAYVVSYNGEMRDPETKSYRVSFTVDWITPRA